HGCARRVSRDGFTTSLDRAPLKPLGLRQPAGVASSVDAEESRRGGRSHRRVAARRPLPPKSRGAEAAPTVPLTTAEESRLDSRSYRRYRGRGAEAAPTGLARVVVARAVHHVRQVALDAG